MAESRNNIIVRGMSGSIGKQLVFKQYGDRTIVSAMPDMSKVVKSKKQKAENVKFSEASAYAQAQMADPVSKAEYKAKAKGLQKPHNVAIADFYNPPEIRKIDATDVRATKTVTIYAIDDFMVTDVTVEVYDTDGVLLEQGHAVETSQWFWAYQIMGDISSLNGIRLVVAAFDKPGNKTTQEIEVSFQ